jgi:hypothetical protein
LLATVAHTGNEPARAPTARFALLGLFGLVLLATGLRLVPIVIEPSVNWWDEVFQTTEQAHRLLYGYGLVPWEFQLGMRSWLLPGLVAGIMKLTGLIGEGPDYYLRSIAVAFGLLAAAPVVCCFLWTRRYYGAAGALAGSAAVAIAPELIYFGARTLSEVVAAHVLVIGCYLLDPSYRVESRQRLFAAGVLFGLTCLLRIHLAPAIALFVVWSRWRAFGGRFPFFVVGGAAALAFGAIFDWATLGSPLASVWRNVLYNLIYGVSAEFGVEPWYYYVAGELGIWGSGALFLIVFVALGARRLPGLLAAAMTIVVVHSCIVHKEYRFMYPAVVLLMVLAGFGVAQLVQWATEWLQTRGLHRRPAAAVGAGVVLACWAIMTFSAWKSPVLAQLRHRDSDNLAAASFAASIASLCGLGLYGEEGRDWVWYGGYSHLHRPRPMYWPKDQAELSVTAPAFNTLIYTRSPPPELGFAGLQCFGRVCVAQRPGACMERAMTAMPFPEALAAHAPPKEKFEAIPAQPRQP